MVSRAVATVAVTFVSFFCSFKILIKIPSSAVVGVLDL